MEKLVTIFRIPELRTKIFFTLFMLAIYRLGLFVTLPFIDQQNLRLWADRTFGSNSDFGAVVGQIGMFSGTDIGASTIFGLGIMPYISASIIFQLLASVVPALEKLQKEGEVGRKKINEYTRYAAVVISFVQSAIWVNIVMSATVGSGAEQVPLVNPRYNDFFHAAVAVIVMTSGTIFLMWIGEQIDEYGIGNGISLIIMAGIVGRMPATLMDFMSRAEFSIAPANKTGIEKMLFLVFLFLAVIIGVIIITQGQRRIPIQSARHVRGRRTFGGNRQYLPLRLNQAGVMPIIFASSLLMFPMMILTYLSRLNYGDTGFMAFVGSFFQKLNDSFGQHGYLYILGYIVLIYFFCYFWTAITFNPKDMSNNLKDYGSFIPGYRPGRQTATFLERVMLRITYVGAAFLSIIAIVPNLVQTSLGVDFAIASFFGGTGLLIIISVALDLVQKIDSHLIMRNYNSLLGPTT